MGMIFDLERVSLAKFRSVYYGSFFILMVIVWFASSDSYFNIGFYTVALLQMIFTEFRLIIIREGIAFEFLRSIYKNKALAHLFIMTFEFLLFLFLLFLAVWKKVLPPFFLGFFIAYFINLIILVMSSKLPKRL